MPPKTKKNIRPKPRQQRAVNTRIKHLMRGNELKVPPQPPPITTRPWFNLTVRIDNIGISLNSRDVINAINTQLGFQIADGAIGFQLQRIKIWGPLVPFQSPAPLTPISVTFVDFIGVTNTSTTLNNARVLEQYTRYPDQTRRASVGYSYPIAHQDITLVSNSATNNTNILQTKGLGSGSVAYVYLKWRSTLLSFPESSNINDFELLN
jgi:hypothetical protein